MTVRKARVLMTNNYDMPLQLKLWQDAAGERPSQHLWGVAQLERAGYRTTLIPFRTTGLAARISATLPLFGDLTTQWYALTHLRDYDVLYSAHQNPLLFLAFLRRIGVFPRPIVSVLFRSYGRSAAARLFLGLALRGYDVLMTLTEDIARAMRINGTWSEHRLGALPWGLDLPAFDQAIEDVAPATGAERHFMSAGKTYRDFGVLVEAFRQLPEKLRVYYSPDNDSALAAKAAANGLANISFRDLEFADWRNVSIINKQAFAVLVPLDLTKAVAYANGFGMTSLLDAMGAGRPVIMTRTPYPVIDVEREGIGIFVDGADPANWAAAIRRLADDPEAAEAMGRRARQLCETTYSIETYAKGLMAHIDRVHAEAAGKRVGLARLFSRLSRSGT
jgi:glycosyltransferase involved in cell wall biosynthesis